MHTCFHVQLDRKNLGRSLVHKIKQAKKEERRKQVKVYKEPGLSQWSQSPFEVTIFHIFHYFMGYFPRFQDEYLFEKIKCGFIRKGGSTKFIRSQSPFKVAIFHHFNQFKRCFPSFDSIDWSAASKRRWHMVALPWGDHRHANIARGLMNRWGCNFFPRDNYFVGKKFWIYFF